MSLSAKSREKLTAVSTATLTTVLFKRGFRNTFIQGIHRLNPAAPAMPHTTIGRTRKATDDDGTHPRAAQRGRGAL